MGNLMENTLEKTKTKKMGILELMNNCRIKLSGLYSLINAGVVSAKQYSINMGIVNTKISELYDNMRGVFIAITNSNKEDRPKNIRASKPVVKKTKSEIASLTEEFYDLIEKFDRAVDKAHLDLRTQYKNDVASCCRAYKSINESNEALDKGYRQQVKLIKRVLEKINEIILVYKEEKEKVAEQKTHFDRTLNFASTLSDKIIEAN